LIKGTPPVLLDHAAQRARGGLTLVQDPEEARNPTMPARAIAEDDVDAVLRLEQMGDALASLVTGGAHQPASR
jgi:chemotaxis response regulator CheB